LLALAREANIATLMLEGLRTQTTPADERSRRPGAGKARAELGLAGLLVSIVALVAFTMLFWLFVVSRVIVASAMLNAALVKERRLTSEEVLHA
jgi:hypothetical protein